MEPLLVLFVIASVSLLVVRVGATALMMTGLAWDTSNFQSYSAFFGVGFTTKEAELVVSHPVRRRIIRDLILAGNIGFTSTIATLIVTLQETDRMLVTLAAVGIGAIAFLSITRLGMFKRLLDGVIRFTLTRAGVVHAMDYELLLRVQNGYCVSEVEILPGSSLAGKTLGMSRPADRGIVVLGITRADGSFRGAPGAKEELEVGDVATVYGREPEIRTLAQEGA